MPTVQIDMGYRPRDAFRAFHMREQRWACLVAHRRAGKTVATVADLADAALSAKLPNSRFAYIAPFYNQAKNLAWQYLKDFAAPYIQYGAKINETELKVRFPNDAEIRLYGADNPDSLRGIYLDGVVLDEYADMDPGMWSSVLRPALADRKGWAVFIGTPKGHNAFFDLWDRSKRDPEWFTVMLKASETGLVDQDELISIAGELTKEEYAQEMECSFEAAVKGAFYGDDLARADAEQRIISVPYERGKQVITAWDLGFTDSTAIWFAQKVGREIHLIDYYEANNEGLDHYAHVLKEKGYLYSQHLLPHDVEHHELSSGKSRSATLRALGITPTVVPVHKVLDGINAARMIMDRCWFDAEKCKRGIEALRLYRRDWDERGKIFRANPLHDWTSHGADSFRYLAAGLRDNPIRDKPIDRYRQKDGESGGSAWAV